MKDDIKSLLARKMMATISGEITPGDLAEIRRLAEMARQRGYVEIAENAFEIAKALEDEPRGEGLK